MSLFHFKYMCNRELCMLVLSLCVSVCVFFITCLQKCVIECLYARPASEASEGVPWVSPHAVSKPVRAG